MTTAQKLLSIVLVAAVLAAVTIPVMAAETKGKIAAVHVQKKQVVLTETFKNLTFEVNNGTRIYLNDLETKLADLRPGDEAGVAFEKEGQALIATTIRVRRK